MESQLRLVVVVYTSLRDIDTEFVRQFNMCERKLPKTLSSPKIGFDAEPIFWHSVNLALRPINNKSKRIYKFPSQDWSWIDTSFVLKRLARIDSESS